MEVYTHGHFGTVVDDHASRTAANSAAFLLPHLRPGDVLLDVGCGPGSITLDLAERVTRAVGVDGAAEAIDRARRDAAAKSVSRAVFQVANVYALPFRDESFDVLYAHQLLQHLGAPVDALREAIRVLKRGGILAVRDSDYGTMVHDPHEPRIERWLELYHALARHNGGEPDAGRMLSGWVRECGFVDITPSTSTWTYATPASVEAWCKLWTNRLLHARMGRDAVEIGLATQQDLQEMAEGWESWAGSTQPFFAFLHGEVLAKKP